jgi:hypothetical protein
MTDKRAGIRTVYLYIFTIVGLVLLIIGGVRFIDMGLKAFVFTEAEKEESLYWRQPPMYYPIEKLEAIDEGDELSAEEREAIKRWLVDYHNWEENRSQIDPVTSRRHRDASINLAMILVGTPLYVYHWTMLRRESSTKQENNSVR